MAALQPQTAAGDQVARNRKEQFDGNCPIEASVPSAVDLSHASGAERDTISYGPSLAPVGSLIVGAGL